MTPAEFHPEFQSGLRAANNLINPEFCLTPQSAVALQALLANDRPCGIVNLHPLTGQNVQPLVPWCAFPRDGGDPVNVNAGQLADSFTHGKNPDTAYQEMLAHIDQSIADAG